MATTIRVFQPCALGVASIQAPKAPGQIKAEASAQLTGQIKAEVDRGAAIVAEAKAKALAKARKQAAIIADAKASAALAVARMVAEAESRRERREADFMQLAELDAKAKGIPLAQAVAALMKAEPERHEAWVKSLRGR